MLRSSDYSTCRTEYSSFVNSQYSVSRSTVSSLMYTVRGSTRLQKNKRKKSHLGLRILNNKYVFFFFVQIAPVFPCGPITIKTMVCDLFLCNKNDLQESEFYVVYYKSLRIQK